MPNVAKNSQPDGQKHEKVSAERDYGKPSSTPQSSGSSPRKSDENNYLAMQNFMPTTSSSESDEEDVSEVRLACPSAFCCNKNTATSRLNMHKLH
jgi:hypothetical protein